MASPDTKLIEINPPLNVMLGVWWGFMWRSVLWMIPLMIVLVLIAITLGFVVGATGGSNDFAGLLGSIMGFVISFGGYIWIFIKVMKQLMRKKFGGYQLVFLTPAAIEAGAEPPRVSPSSHPDSV